MKKVLHISTTYLKNSETFVYSPIKCAKNYEPYVLCEEWINKERFPTKNVYEMKKLSLVERGINLISKQTSLRNLSSEKYYSEIIEKVKPDVILAHFGQIGMYATPLRDKFKIPLVTYFYGIDLNYKKLNTELGKSGSNKIHFPLISKSNYWQEGYKRLWEKGDAFLTFSEMAKDYLVKELKAPESKVTSIPGGVDLNVFKYRKRILPKNGEFKLVSVNRLVEKKGVEYAIRAMPLILSRYPSLTYEIIGKGPLFEDLIRLVKDLKLEKSVKLLGFVSEEEKIKKLEEAHLFINPSIVSSDGDIEGWVNVTLMESIAEGLPAVATTESGSETIIPGISGSICKQKDYNDLALCVIDILSNPERYQEFNKKARKLAEENFDEIKQTRKLEALFDALVKE